MDAVADFPALTEDAIRDALAYPDAWQLGEACQRAGKVIVLNPTHEGRRIQGVVKGAKGRTYLAQANLDDAGAIATTSCTCPFGEGCKHVAAMLMQVRRKASQDPEARSPAHRTFTRPPAWERALAPLTSSPLAETAGGPDGNAALVFRVNGLGKDGRLLPTRGGVQALSLSIHPGVPGPRGWVVGYSADWPGVYARREYDPWTTDWLRALVSASPERYSYGTPWLELGRLNARLLWALLAEGAAAGIPFVGTAAAHEIHLATSMDVELDVREDAGGLVLSRRVLVDGEPFEHDLAGAIGESGLFAIRLGQGPTRTVVLGPGARPLGRAGALAVCLDPLVVAPGETDRFWSRTYPGLQRRVGLVSGDGSVAMPALPTPSLVVSVAFPDVRHAHMTCGWEYGGTAYPWKLDDAWRNTGVGDRDSAAEQAIVERARAALGDLAAILGAPTGVDGMRAVALARALPALRAVDGVDVRLVGTVPDYREPAEAPSIAVSVADGTDNDWFDLGITVSLEGRDVPFAPLFTAIARGQDVLVLDDGTLLRTDLPAFERLRDLIDEARQLTDRPGPLRLNRYAAGLWNDFSEVADVVTQGERWRTTVGALARYAVPGADLGLESVAVPTGLVAELRPYQIAGYRWLVLLRRLGLGGVLADDMGLGKTLEVLALIAHAVEDAGPSDAPFLVVAPASVVSNWGREAARFTPGLRTTVLTSTIARTGGDLADVARTSDLVVTSYAIFRLDFEAFSQVAWAGLILDEAQFLKNAKTRANECARALGAPFKLAVTGTPMENNLMELWAILAVVAPGLFPHASRFREDYVQPVAAAARARDLAPGTDDEPAQLDVARGRAALARLRSRVRPLLLRRTKEAVAPELPDRIEQVLAVELAPRHRRIYDTLLQRERARVLGLLDDFEANRFEVFRSLMLLRRAALDVALIDPAYEGVDSAKVDVLFEQLEDVVAAGHRALVFSQFTTFLARIGARASERGYAYAYLDGRTRQRARVIEGFRTGDAPLFLISLKAGGFGLNLTEADYVFLMDPWWNPATENQAIDRTHRIGQTRTVMVSRLVSSGTIEDKVMALKARKAELFDAVLDDDSGAFARSLAADDIRALFEAD